MQKKLPSSQKKKKEEKKEEARNSLVYGASDLIIE